MGCRIEIEGENIDRNTDFVHQILQPTVGVAIADRTLHPVVEDQELELLLA